MLEVVEVGGGAAAAVKICVIFVLKDIAMVYTGVCCSSAVYKIDESGRLLLYQKLPTRGAVSVTTFTAKMDGSSTNASYLVIANNRDNAGNIEQDVVIYGWHNITEQFRPIQTIPATDVQKVHAFEAAKSLLVNNLATGMWLSFYYYLLIIIL